jgi:hypothetical protein
MLQVGALFWYGTYSQPHFPCLACRDGAERAESTPTFSENTVSSVAEQKYVVYLFHFLGVPSANKKNLFLFALRLPGAE